MVQATNELILGFELNETHAQMTYYHQSVKEPLTLEKYAERLGCQMPMALRCDENGCWRFWNKEEQESCLEDRCQISDVYGRIIRDETAEYDGKVYTAADLLALYFQVCMDQLKILTQNTKLQIMVTVQELTEHLSDVITQALEHNGVERKFIYVQDYLSSFYYYTVNQKKELWYQDVALLTYEKESIVGYVLHIDRSTRPAVAKVEKAASQKLDQSVRGDRSEQEWNREKDRLFFELLKKLFERRTVSVSYLIGDYFNKSWAERSIQYLCYKRHAFQGQNLFSKGACYAAMERAGLIAGREILFGGRDMIQWNIGMEMNIRGKKTYYPLVSAGINWYEAHHTCEFILNQEREVKVISRPMTQGEDTVHSMRLPGLPKRPDRGTRLRMTLYFSSPTRCHLEVEDLGFGGLARSSGLVWTRMIQF